MPSVSPGLGVRHVRVGPRRGLFEVLPSIGRYGVTAVMDGVVGVEFPLCLVRHKPKDAEVAVGHDRALPGSVIAKSVGTAATYGSWWGRSSGPTRRKPRVRSGPVIGCGEPSHSGQATM